MMIKVRRRNSQMKMIIVVFIVRVRRQFSNGDDQPTNFYFVICESEKTIHFIHSCRNFLAVFFREASLIVYVLYQAPQILWKCVFYCPIFCSCSYPCKHFVCMRWDLFVVFPGFSYEKKGTATVKSRLLFILPQLSCEKIEEGKRKTTRNGRGFLQMKMMTERGPFFILLSFERIFFLHTILM